jgi:Mitochondrial K+-H+ exchange-related
MQSVIDDPQSAILYFTPREGNDSPELLLFEERLIEDPNRKATLDKPQSVWSRLRKRYDHFALEKFAGDRFVRKLHHLKKVTILLNKPIDPTLVKLRFKQMLKDRSYHHLRWLVVNTMLLPVSLLLMPLPGPNVWGYYLLYRVYSHWKSYRSASQMKLEKFDIQVSNHAQEVSEYVSQNRDIRSALRELRVKYGLRALQEHQLVPVSGEFWASIKRKFTRS